MARRASFLIAVLIGTMGGLALESEPASAQARSAHREDGAQCRIPVTSVVEVGRTPPPAPPARDRVPPCPTDMVQIGLFCVDRFEAHLVTVDEEGGETKHPFYERPERGVRYEARSAPGEFPQAYVSRIEAERACEAAGKRLCTRTEWQRACMGARGARFPYGDVERPGTCNTGKEHLFGKVFGKNPRNWVHAAFNSPELNKEPGFLTRSGEMAQCRSEDGVYDMVGNVHEWVADPVTRSFVEALKTDGFHRHDQPWKPGNAMFMGGFYATKNEHGPGCHFVTVAHERRYHDYTTGFRCCADARTES